MSSAAALSPGKIQSSMAATNTVTRDDVAHESPIETATSQDLKPSFNYDLEVFNLCKEYLNSKNHHGLALVARQKGIPPFLRFKVWPILLKFHPFVLDPFIQPDSDIINEANDSDTSLSLSFKNATNETPAANQSRSVAGDDRAADPESKVKRDIARYIQRTYGSSAIEMTSMEKEIIKTIENAVLKFTMKWSKIIKYDTSLSWMALNLAEWFPPVPNTPWVLVGREQKSSHNALTCSVLDDYSHYIDHVPGLGEYLNTLINKTENSSSMSFHEIYERLVLVLLHCPEPTDRKKKDAKTCDSADKNGSKKSLQLNKTTLPVTGGTIEERVSFFIFCLRKLLPELAQYFHEEQILTKFGSSDDEWLIWWLKFCGTKVWSKHDRGRIWDFMLGWRLKNPKRNFSYYYEKLNYVNRSTLEKLGPDIFWTVSAEQAEEQYLDPRRNSFKDLVKELDDNLHVSKTEFRQAASTSPSGLPASDTEEPTLSIPFSRIDPHVALIFISISLLKSKENTLVELDSHEIRQFLSRLPSKSYEFSNKQRRLTPNSASTSTFTSPLPSPTEEHPINSIIISNDSHNNKHKINFIDSIITEAGEQWRKWLWTEFVDDS
ncbi:uncharacterized protein LODBEIA_P31590 [Lodderomyces beijingensis]|uniref:Oxidant-induced cell-cycle arrest protein 5 n=1 Tax=Lodderomyces beijingensis TaxID=1775926 RepID=A0ABP0ZLB1_9ASCO